MSANRFDLLNGECDAACEQNETGSAEQTQECTQQCAQQNETQEPAESTQAAESTQQCETKSSECTEQTAEAEEDDGNVVRPSRGDMKSTRAVQYSLTQENWNVLNKTKTYFSQWTAKNEDGSSLSENFGQNCVGDTSSLVVAWALLAAVDDMVTKFRADPSEAHQEPVLSTLARSGFVELARAVIKTNHPLTMHFNDIYVKGNRFNSKVHLTERERETCLNDASVWTLVKALSGQIRKSINRCFHPDYRGCYLIHGEVESSHNQTRPSRRYTEEDQYKNDYCVAIEDATWDRRASEELLDALETLMMPYNHMLQSRVNFADAHTASGQLRRQYMRQSEPRQNESRQSGQGQGQNRMRGPRQNQAQGGQRQEGRQGGQRQNQSSQGGQGGQRQNQPQGGQRSNPLGQRQEGRQPRGQMRNNNRSDNRSDNRRVRTGQAEQSGQSGQEGQEGQAEQSTVAQPSEQTQNTQPSGPRFGQGSSRGPRRNNRPRHKMQMVEDGDGFTKKTRVRVERQYSNEQQYQEQPQDDGQDGQAEQAESSGQTSDAQRVTGSLTASTQVAGQESQEPVQQPDPNSYASRTGR